MHGRGHLVFATDQQLKQLCKVKSWYIDGNFKLCRQLLQQRLTISAFLWTEDHAQQVPFVFVLVSGRKKKDKKEHLAAIILAYLHDGNDSEGWHNALNRQAAGKWQMSFYLLIEL